MPARFPPLAAPESVRSRATTRSLPLPSLPWGEVLILATLLTLVRLAGA